MAARRNTSAEIVNAVLYLDRAGCAWRLWPKCFPPWETVYWHWARWKTNGTADRVHDALRDRLRDASGRDPMASAGVIDSQSLRGADTVGADQRGYDAGKRTNGTKRHIVVDTLGLLLVVLVTAASVQDRDGGRRLLERLRFAMPSVALVWADGGYAGRLVIWARKVLSFTVEVSSASMTWSASRFCPDAGSSSAPSPGSASTAAASVTTRPCPSTTKPWSTFP